MPIRSRIALTLLSLLSLDAGFTILAADPKPTPRHDPPDQLFRRAPMAQSARSIAINLGTNLHAAFDTDLARVHTLWTGGPLNLWGPPYSHGKAPFICDFDGTKVFTFPPVSPWISGNAPLKPNFIGIHVTNGIVHFTYDLSSQSSSSRTQVIESLEGVATNDSWTVRRTFHFPTGIPQNLRYLAFAEGGAKTETKDHLLVTSTNGLVHFASGPDKIPWSIETPEVNYTAEIITDEGTENGNPNVNYRGPETRAFLEIPATKEAFSFSITLSSGPTPAAIPTRPVPASEKIFSGAKVKRRDSGDAAYRIEHFPLPPEAELLITGMDWITDSDLAVCTWLGEIYIVQNATGPVGAATYRRFARGLNEPLGLTVSKGEIYVVQKGELTRVSDRDGDGQADRFECVSDDWGYSGNYHSYSFGPLVSSPNEFLVFITGQRGRYDLPFQGFALRIGPEGVTPFCSGLRVPHGWTAFQGDIFVADNQGNWIGACRLNHLQPGKFYGFPSSQPDPKGARPASDVEPPVLWLPRSLSPSTSGIEVIAADSFGPFKGQMLLGDFQNSTVMRASLEKIRGKWQGAVFPFAKGFLSGVNRLKMGQDGKLYVGGGKRTWSTAAPQEFSLDRISFTGKMPFEVREVRATQGGFQLFFTKALEADPALDPENYLVKQFTYKYHQDYGSPEFDHAGKVGATETPVTEVKLSRNRDSVLLTIPTLKTGFVTSFQLAINSDEDEDLRNDQFYYTLNQVPD